MTPKLWIALGAAVFLLVAGYMFGPEAAQNLFEALGGVVGGVE